MDENPHYNQGGESIMNIRSIDLFIFPLEDIHCGYGLQQGNILPALSYIPGRVVRGGLAGWAIRTGKVTAGDHVFNKLFLPESGNPEISFPNCTYKGLFPGPASLFEAKGKGQDPQTILVKSPPPKFIFTGEDNDLISREICAPVDFLRRNIWPSDIAHETLKPHTGFVDEYGEVYPPPPTVLDLKAPHEESGRVGKGTTGSALFAEEALPSSMATNPKEHYYKGILNFVEEKNTTRVFETLIDESFDIESIDLENPDPAHLVFIGHRRVPAVVFGEDRGCIDSEKNPLPSEFEQIVRDETFSITFTSDLIIAGSNSPYPLTSEMIQSLLSLCALRKKRVFCKMGMAHGYDVQNNRKLNPITTIAGGSCGFFEGAFEESQVREMWARSLLGIGQDEEYQNGFGRFKVNWEIHNYNKGGNT